jgi:LysR family transcriptional regulator, nitrogen assimilation regulatory protein
MTDLVMAGLGDTVLPACGVRALLAQNKVTASPFIDLFITWLIAPPKTRSLGVAVEQFYDMYCELGRKQIRDGIWESAA